MPRVVWVRAVALSVATAALWGVNGLFVRGLSEGLGVSDALILLLRHGLAGLALLAVFLAERARGRGVCTLHGVVWSAITGVLGLFVSNLCNLYVMRTVSVTAAVMFTNTAVVFVLVFGCLLARRRPSPIQVAGSVLAFAGVGLVTWQSSAEATAGILPVFVGLFSGVASGVYPFLFAKALEDGTSPVAATGVALLAAGAAALPVLSLDGASVSPAAWPALFGAGLACALITRAIPQTLYARAVRLVEPWRDSALPALAVITTFEVVVAAVVSWAFLGEDFGWAKAAGVGLLVLASALVNRLFDGSGAKVGPLDGRSSRRQGNGRKICC